MTDKSLQQERPESKAERLLRAAAAETVAEFRRRNLPRVGLENFTRGAFQVLVGEHPELAPMRSRFAQLVSEPFPADQQQTFGQGTR